MSRLKILLVSASLVAMMARAEIPVQDTTITVKKGVPETQCVAFEVIDGKEEVTGDPEFDRAKAHTSWKTACAEWKKEMREMNKDNQILTLNCNGAKASKDTDRHSYHSTGTYKIKVRVREKM